LNSGQKAFLQFRDKYPDFIFEGYDYSVSAAAPALTLDIAFRFCIPNLAEFTTSWSVERHIAKPVNEDIINSLVFGLGMVELVSYLKLTCSPNVFVECGGLTQGQVEWFKKLYRLGLSEFFFINGITANDDFMDIHCAGAAAKTNRAQADPAQGDAAAKAKVLVPIGGGKDSAVTLSLLDAVSTERYCYMINPAKAMTATVNTAGLQGKTIIAKRTLDKTLTELNSQGFLNGHTPFSAVVAFSSVLAAYINGIGYVALSNEASANEATVADTQVNHQYSKSYEFENDFRQYEKGFIGSGVEYFSLLRPLNELQIAKLFSELKGYHSVFRSCNAGSKTGGVWCCRCPKCLFVYIILSPFVEPEELVTIFGKDLLGDPGLTDIFYGLSGILPDKPFECVGTRQEVAYALWLTADKYKAQNIALPYLLRLYTEKFEDAKPEPGSDGLLTYYNEDNFLPCEFAEIIRPRL